MARYGPRGIIFASARPGRGSDSSIIEDKKDGKDGFSFHLNAREKRGKSKVDERGRNPSVPSRRAGGASQTSQSSGISDLF